MMRRHLISGLILPLLTWSCTGESQPPDRFTVRDSAGVRIVENYTAAWGEGEGWRFGEEPLVDIGVVEGDPNYELYMVLTPLRLADGRIVFGDGGTQDIRFYDAEGTFLHSTGRKGSGPGEFEDIRWVKRYRGDSLLAWDIRLHRFSVYDQYGNLGRSFVVGRVGDPWSSFSDGSILTYTQERPPRDAPKGMTRLTFTFDKLTSTGGQAGTLGSFPGAETYVKPTSRGMSYGNLLFSRFTSWQNCADSFCVATKDSYEYRVYTQEGVLRSIVRLDQENRLVTAEDIEYQLETRVNRIENEQARRRVAAMYDEMPIPKTMPAFGGIKSDRLGNVWIGEYRSRRSGYTRDQTVFAVDGRLLGTVALPDRFAPADIDDRYVVGTWYDDLNVIHVRVYELIKP